MSKKSHKTIYECRFPTEVIEWFDLAYNFTVINIQTTFFTLSVDEKKKIMVKNELNFIPIYVETNCVENNEEKMKYHVEQLVILFHDVGEGDLILFDCNIMKIPNIYGRDIFKKIKI